MNMKPRFRTLFILFTSFSLMSMGALTSMSFALEELEMPQIPPPQLEEPKIQGLNKTDKGVSPIQPVNLDFFPEGIAVDLSGNVFVSDRGHEDKAQYRMIKYTTDGKYVKRWGKFGSGISEFDNPRGVGVDSKGNVFVADGINDRIQKFSNNGQYIDQWPIPDVLKDGWGPSDAEADLHPSFGNVYVTNTQKNRILVYTNIGTPLLMSWGKFGHGNGEFWHPESVTVDNKGNVFVADTGNNRIQKFKIARPCPEGTLPTATNPSVCFVKSWPVKASPKTDSHPTGIGVDSKGNLFVADPVNNQIQKFDNNGGFLDWWGKKGMGDGEFRGASDVDVDPNTGDVFVADTNNQRIQKFDNNGEFISKWSLSGTGTS